MWLCRFAAFEVRERRREGAAPGHHSEDLQLRPQPSAADLPHGHGVHEEESAGGSRAKQVPFTPRGSPPLFSVADFGRRSPSPPANCPLPPLTTSFAAGFQITVFRMGGEGQQDIEMSILTALLKGQSSTCAHHTLTGDGLTSARVCVQAPTPRRATS